MKVKIISIAILSIASGLCYSASAKDLSSVRIESTNIRPHSVLVAELDCQESKKRNGNKGKAAADDAPSWVKNEGHAPCKNPNEDGKTFAKRLLDGKYGIGNYKTGPNSEYNKTQKYGDRAFD